MLAGIFIAQTLDAVIAESALPTRIPVPFYPLKEGIDGLTGCRPSQRVFLVLHVSQARDTRGLCRPGIWASAGMICPMPPEGILLSGEGIVVGNRMD